MAHFARINDENIVQEVQVVSNDDLEGGNFPDSEPLGQAFQASLGLEGQWLQVSYSASFRDCYPGEGWEWHPDDTRSDGGYFTAPPATQNNQPELWETP